MAADHAMHGPKWLRLGFKVAWKCVLALVAYGAGNGAEVLAHVGNSISVLMIATLNIMHSVLQLLFRRLPLADDRKAG